MTAVTIDHMMEHNAGEGITKPVVVGACTALSVFYVAILYFPTLVLRLPPPISYKSFMIRRFLCAAVSSVVSLIVCAFVIPIRRWDASNIFSVYGIGFDHIWQALVYPLSLTSFLYLGSFALKLSSMLQGSSNHDVASGYLSHVCVKSIFLSITERIIPMASDVSFWRNYVVAPLTEELVFRACMIPLLLCGGFGTYTVVFLCPIFFALAHLNHLYEFYFQKNYSLLKASTVVGFQLGYTIIFGTYASFLLVRTGHLAAPLIAHIFCNFMGLPVIFSRNSGLVIIGFAAGLVCFLWMLFPLTSPHLYNHRTDNCSCWHRYCSWS